jgi:uracil-DNA glycosylase
MLSINNILKDVKQSWIPLLDNDRLELILTKLNKFKTDNKQKILPTKNRIFEAFKYFELNQTKVCWIGTDPYISCHQATGLSFSVPEDCKIPPSLKNIYTELKLYDKSHGNLTNWVINNQFLMLNSSLTVFEGKSNTHKKIWKEYTNKLIKDISDKTTKIIFLLFGKEAQSKVKYIDTTKHIIINSVHPSPLSAYNGFFNSKIFDKLDNYYEKIFKKKIDWNIN